MLQSPGLSSRGQSHRDKVTPFWSIFDQMLGNAYCHESNTGGFINMGIANNFLMEPELLDFFHDNLRLVPSDLTYGTSLFGSIRLFRALCLHYNSKAFSPVSSVSPEHIMTGPGCGPLLDQIFEHLADPGDGVLIAAPYYNGFEADLSCRSAVKCVPVHSSVDDGTGSLNFEGRGAMRGFNEALGAWNSTSGDKKIRATLVCNPNNPVGRCYDRSALIAYGTFAEQHDLHLVFDEIYALSTFEAIEDEQPRQAFISALNIDWAVEAGCHPARVHVLSSASKDFGMNGFRIGTLVSQANSELIRAMKATAKLYMVSAPADALFSALLCDQTFYQNFVATNQKRMGKAYQLVTKWCRHHGIRYTPANAGHFILVDLKRFMPNSAEGHVLTNSEREGALWAKALENCVALTPGSNYHHPRNGTFRLTFTLRRPALLEGLARLEKTLELEHWKDAGKDYADEVPMVSAIPPVFAAEPAVSDVVQPREICFDGPQVDLSYSDIVTASEILKGQPCAC
ncbi:hypothetical protein CBS101457_001043 [Exobasidium rhododendri]|nr:hypothetical protein CBS101457_001043 [Exobasidium rhododendri]